MECRAGSDTKTMTAAITAAKDAFPEARAFFGIAADAEAGRYSCVATVPGGSAKVRCTAFFLSCSGGLLWIGGWCWSLPIYTS
jgi:hypothetical protein